MGQLLDKEGGSRVGYVGEVTACVYAEGNAQVRVKLYALGE